MPQYCGLFGGWTAWKPDLRCAWSGVVTLGVGSIGVSIRLRRVPRGTWVEKDKAALGAGN